MSKKNLGNDGTQANAPKFARSVSRTLQRGHSASGYFKIRGYERLSGGADAKSKSTDHLSKSGLEANSVATLEIPEKSNVAPEAEKEIEAILANSNDVESTGNKKVDDMIEYVIKNLQEAGKALASLGENFEHDLKLVFVDVMGKVQKWVSVAQMRIDAARNDLKNLRNELVNRLNELAARDKEIEDVRKKLAESQIAKSAIEKAFIEGGMKSVAPLPSPSMMSFQPSRQPIRSTGASQSDHLAGGASSSVHPAGASVTSAQSSRLTAPGTDGLSSIATLQQQQQASRSQQQVSPATTDAAVQSGKGKERRRESELESELARLRKENERIARERTDYENAIQRALLRGVSSLNAETLKVLRCPPPVTCYTPCGPPPSPVNTVETMTPCPSTRPTDDRVAKGCGTAPAESSRRGGSNIRVDGSFVHEDRGCCGSMKPTTSNNLGSASRHRKSSGGSTRSMAFILQQAATPLSCVAPCNASQPRSCGRAKSKKLEASICTRKFA